MNIQDLDILVIGGAIITIGALGYLVYTNIDNIGSAITDIPKEIARSIESKSLQTGADQSTNSNNYKNANVVYTNTTSGVNSAIQKAIPLGVS